MGIVYRIKQEIKAQNTTIAAVERALGLGNGTISKWDKQSPSCNNMLKLANYLNCTVDYLLNGKEKSSLAEKLTADEQRLLTYYNRLSEFDKGIVIGRAELLAEQSEKSSEDSENTVFIEYYSLPVSAGTGVDLDGCEKGMLEVEETQLTLHANFALRVSGNSMEPVFHNGDIVLIASQPSVEIGEIGIFILNGEGFIKKFGGDCLISLNPDYDDIPLNEYNSIYCRGKVIGTV
ncbi:S24 family peptidase [Ruminococcus sp. Marseille-P6503]|uniref:XRE family transcriptional regulator n=1 Tax=Ruminococcus sp. Marseille-P6503 TaxID=2364796 RepID=UPI000F54BB0A|nr:S24 family peptidase [Ruminococcus sp. Marseille-P6503]